MPAAKRPLTVDDLWAVRRVGAPAVSADGALLIVPVADTDMEANTSRTRLYRVTPGDGRVEPLTSEAAGASSPFLSPDGAWVAFVRKDGDAPGQLARINLHGGEAEVLTDLPLSVTDPRWFPDGKRIAFVAWVLVDAPTPEGTRDLLNARSKNPVKAHVTEDRIYRFWDTWLTDGRVPHLFVLDLGTRTLTDLIPDSRRWFDFMEPAGAYDIAPDGTEVAFSANRSEPPHDPMNWDVFTVPAAGGAVTNLTLANPAHDTRPRYSPDGRWIVYGMQRMNDFYADRVRLVAYDRKRGEHRVLTEDWDRSAMGWTFDPAGDGLVLTAENAGRTGVYRMTLEPGSPVLLRAGGSYGDLRPVADGSVFALRNTLSEPSEVVRIPATGDGDTAVTAFNRGFMDRIALGDVEELFYTGADGRRIQSWLVLPPDFDSKKSWPLVEVLHGGPHGITGDQFHFRWNLQLLAAPGYVVLAPNFHGSTSWGQEFAASIHGGWGDRPFTDAMAAVDALLERGYVDPGRMAAAGASYGGYLVSWIAGHTDRFACIVNHAGVSDTLAQFGSDVTFGRERAMGGNPWEGMDAVDRMNPLRFAEGFTTPMFISHGEQDYRVPVNQGVALYNVLKAKGVPARLVYFPDENHWVLKPRNSRLWYQEVQSWLARWFEDAAD
jgi:dipeptidyl aminopeptidase/acylaminoacyl peptidase